MDDSQYKIIVVGSGGNGQLLQGIGNLDDHDEFIHVDFIQNFGAGCSIKKMKLNGMQGLMLTQDDRVFHWGEILNHINYIPRQLPNVHGVISLSCGWQHTLVLTHQGLFGFGSNRFSELGLPHSSYSEPHMVPVPPPIRKVYAGFRQSMLIMASGEVLGCGSSKFGELGSLTKVVKEFRVLPVPANARQIKFGQKHTLLLTESGELYGWGDNSFGQLGQKSQQIVSLLCTDVKDFDSGWSHHVVLRNSSPYVMITGRGDFGQLGIASQDHKYSYIPLDDKLVQNKIGESILKVKCGAHSTYLIRQQCILVTGWYTLNEHGNLGNGTKQNIYQFELMKYKENQIIKVLQQ